MCEPWYRDIPAEEIPEFRADGITVRVIAGSSHGVAGAVRRDGTEPLYLDLHLQPGALFAQPLPALHNALVHVYRGGLDIGGTALRRGPMAILGNGQDTDGVLLTAGAEGARAILVAGRPLKEPIVQYGPFVMNSKEQIYEAVEDFRAGRLG